MVSVDVKPNVSFPYQATAVQRLLNRQGAPSLAVRVTFSCEAESEWASKCLRSPLAQHACVGAPDAKHLIMQPNTADRPHKHAHGAEGGEGCHGREGCRCSASPSCPNCPGPHSAAWLGCCSEYRTRPLANKIKAQIYMPYNHAIRQAKQILHNHTDST